MPTSRSLPEPDEPYALGVAPCTEISSTVVRTSVPVELMSMISCPGMTCSAATVTPLRSEVCSAITPWPPRPCGGKSASGVRLP